MRVFITGLNGFIGSLVSDRFLAENHEVHGSVRSSSKLAGLAQRGINASVISLGSPFDANVFEGVDLVIHCAHDFSKNSQDRNINGTIEIFRAARMEGVKQQVFLGSYSAHQGCETEYGLTKWKLENYFKDEGELVLKPGLIVGRGGLFLKIFKLMRLLPILPLIDSGRGLIPILGATDLLNALQLLVQKNKKGIVRLYHSERVSLKEFACEIRRSNGLWVLFFPLPVFIVLFATRVLSVVGIQLGVNEENIRGFESNQSVSDESDLKLYVKSPQNLSEMIQSIPK